MSVMPSLVRYFATVGGALALGLIGLNAVMEQGGPGPHLVKEAAKPIVVRHAPGASLVERLRDDEAARKSLARGEVPVEPAVPAPPPVTAAIVPPPQPVAQAAPDTNAPAALTQAPTEDDAAMAARAAQEKIAAEKARKKRIARAKAKAEREAALSQQQDQIYYGYAPRPTYGPFGQGRWAGGNWNQR